VGLLCHFVIQSDQYSKETMSDPAHLLIVVDDKVPGVQIVQILEPKGRLVTFACSGRVELPTCIDPPRGLHAGHRRKKCGARAKGRYGFRIRGEKETDRSQRPRVGFLCGLVCDHR